MSNTKAQMGEEEFKLMPLKGTSHFTLRCVTGEKDPLYTPRQPRKKRPQSKMAKLSRKKNRG